jgi:hypothetical protein
MTLIPQMLPYFIDIKSGSPEVPPKTDEDTREISPDLLNGLGTDLQLIS